ncbi:MAG TPA: hypothetical protein DEH78_26090 [Solibacterales bacterium]|nr:hypothetical protein [Bryobacterales bacterium]
MISPDRELGQELEVALQETNQVMLARRLDHYPALPELVRMLRTTAPQVIFLNAQTLSEVQALTPPINEIIPGVQIVAFGRSCEAAVLLEIMRTGIREFLHAPFQIPFVSQALERIAEVLAQRPAAPLSTDQLFTFLPSKPGVGTTTVAVNVAAAISRLADMRVLMMDMDLNSGITRFMLKLTNPHCIVDAAQCALQMDENLWPQLVTSIGQMDVLHSGSMNPDFRIEPTQLRHLVEFARRHYRSICVDLSGNMEKFSLELMHESKRIFLVTTGEINALHLARERLTFLKTVQLDGRVEVVYNRVNKRSGLTVAEVQELVGAPVTSVLTNDYQGVHRALSAGRFVDPAAELGKQITAMSLQMLERKAPASDGRKKFIEYFSLIPGRQSFFEPKKSMT